MVMEQPDSLCLGGKDFLNFLGPVTVGRSRGRILGLCGSGTRIGRRPSPIAPPPFPFSLFPPCNCTLPACFLPL